MDDRKPPAEPTQDRCAVCGHLFDRSRLRPYAAVGPGVSALIASDHPEWRDGASICLPDLDSYRLRHVEALLASEPGGLGDLEREVLESLKTGQVISQDPADDIVEQETFGGRMADRVASLGGSWGFILSFAAVLVLWMVLNVTGWLFEPFDRYPFILLNLALSTMAAFQAPVIMMSQRRQESKDRARAENDYQVNLKAELEIRQVHEKIDHLVARQAEYIAIMRHIERRLDADRVTGGPAA